jgi:hypothetical protein
MLKTLDDGITDTGHGQDEEDNTFDQDSGGGSFVADMFLAIQGRNR